MFSIICSLKAAIIFLYIFCFYSGGHIKLGKLQVNPINR